MNVLKTGLWALAVTLALLVSAHATADCNSDILITKPDSLYIDHGNGTVTDNETGLMWMKCSQGQGGSACSAGSASAWSWKRALELSQEVNGGAGTYGYADWRLPNLNELGSLTEKACYGPSINTSYFPNTQSGGYWSASQRADVGTLAWGIFFGEGNEVNVTKFNTFYVRLVRGGQ